MGKKVIVGSYDATSIKHLEGLESIRKVPGMYIPDTGKEGIHHIAWEIVDNSVDEHLAGHAKSLRVSVDTKKRTVTVTDDGRGVPVETHAQTKRPTIESIFTTLHMGGKFGKQAYAISGGLHGIGSKATCALSDRMMVITHRNGYRYRIEFSRGGVSQPLQKLEKSSKRGTTITFRPDSDVFGRNNFEPKRFYERLEAIAYLCPGLRVYLKVNGDKQELTQREGLAGFLQSRMGNKEKSIGTHPHRFTVNGSFQAGDNRNKVFVPDSKESEGIDVAIHWTDAESEKWFTYVNMIPVPDGGTHVTGAKRAITRVLTSFCDSDGVTGDDFREGLRVAIHMRLREPHFEGQTKNRLNNPECQRMAETVFDSALSKYFSRNGDLVKAVITRAVAVAKARVAYKAARSIASQNAYATKDGRRGLPSKLTAALGCKPEEREVFIVEGGSAGGSAARGRNGYYQEVLALRGKPPNPIRGAETLPKIAKLFGNEEIDSIVRTIGAGHDVTVVGETCNPSKARVSKVIIMCLDLDTHIPLIDGRVRTLGELIEEYGRDNPFGVYARTPEGNTVMAMAYNAHITRTTDEMATVELENGQQLRCTPDHLFAIDNPQPNDPRVQWQYGIPYIEAQHLTVEDELSEGALNLEQYSFYVPTINDGGEHVEATSEVEGSPRHQDR